VPRAAVITPFFVDRDAVCNDVFHSARVLREHGWDARVFAVGGHSERERARPIEELAAFVRAPDDLAYFHFSTGRRDVTDAVAALRCRKVLKFHNVTPPEMFSMWSDELAEASRLGRADMPLVARMEWEAALGDSAYNLSEIEADLAPKVRKAVVPPFHETDGLLALRPPSPSRDEMPRLLTVGRIVQSKGHPFLLRVMRYLVHDLGVRAGLDIVGKPDHRVLGYMRNLALIVREYGLEPYVRFVGEASAEALADRYASCAAFISTSEHEGFCVPVIEAMAFGLPVVALGTTAVPETVGDAGIVWEERDPRRFALTVQRLLASPEERAWLGNLGRERFAARYANPVIERSLLAALGAERVTA